jgi:thioredoxin reductase (NADPH)
MTAAIYAARAELKVLILEHDAPGGKLVKTAEIANWPGLVKSSGVDLALSMYNHVSQLPIDYQYGEVSQILDYQDYKEVQCQDGKSYSGRSIIIASGTKERLLNIPGEKEMIGHGVSFCAICDGAFFKNEEVAVIGGGNSALEETLYLCQLVKKVTIVIRRDQFRADQGFVDAILDNPKVEVIYKHLPVAIISEDKQVKGLEIEDVDSKERRIIAVKGIFPYIGADPATTFVKDLGICDEQGFLVVDQHMATKVAGIYGAGDVCAKTLRQVVTAANDGAIAAVSISHYLK